MGIKQDIKDSLEKFDTTKIDGQPTDKDMNQLTRELGAMLATVPTTNGGGDHGHIGMILNNTEYTSFSTCSNPFVTPKNPGPFPTNIRTNEVDHLRQLAEHKQLIIEYETYQGCLQATRTMIIQAIDPEWLAGLHSERLGFTHCTPIELLNHLRSNGAALDDVNIQELISTMDMAWNPTENLATNSNAMKRSSNSLRRPAAQTFVAFRPFIVKEFSKTTTRKLTAQATGYGIAKHFNTAATFTPDTANLVLETTAELVNAVITQNDKKLDDLIKLQKETLVTFQNLLQKPATRAKTNVVIANATILAFLSKNAGNYRPTRHSALPTGNP
eukprot:CCRYP_006011-RA/>CCRYP_006011-RA protein AED:0.39 eAED:0.39 QI:0/0/0/1/1/1/2/0/328